MNISAMRRDLEMRDGIAWEGLGQIRKYQSYTVSLQKSFIFQAVRKERNGSWEDFNVLPDKPSNS